MSAIVKWPTQRCAGLLFSLFATVQCAAMEGATPSVEVMHWLTSPGNVAALDVLRDGVARQGGRWVDVPMPGAGATGRTAAVDRILGGNPPAVFQFSVGAELSELASRNLIEPVPYQPGDWLRVLPSPVLKAVEYRGRLIAAPVDIRGENWMFYNPALLRSVRATVPTNWEEFVSVAAKLKAVGKVPLALGGQPWQERILFDDILLGIGGRDFYRRVFERLDRKAIDSDTMLKVFQIFGALRADVDQSSPGRRWNQTAAMLIHGQAAFQFMGDWEKDEIKAAGLEPGKDVGCVFAPSSEPAYIMMIDAFAFSTTDNAKLREGQVSFAKAVADRGVDELFARRLGAIPARTDASAAGFDSCSARAIALMRNSGAQLLDPGLSLRGGLSGAIDDSISQFWNSPQMTAEQGRVLLLSTVEESE